MHLDRCRFNSAYRMSNNYTGHPIGDTAFYAIAETV